MGQTTRIMRQCETPPPGWVCTRNAGHEGPCAAVPCPEDTKLIQWVDANMPAGYVMRHGASPEQCVRVLEMNLSPSDREAYAADVETLLFSGAEPHPSEDRFYLLTADWRVRVRALRHRIGGYSL